MLLLHIAIVTIFLSGLLALIFYKNNQLASFIASIGAFIGCVVGIIPVGNVLLTGSIIKAFFPWQMPYGTISLVLDPLSAFFSFIIFFISAISSIYGYAYMKEYYNTKKVATTWFMFNLLIVSMISVCLAQNALFFLLSWELMTISSFFLVAFEYKKTQVRRAAWTYLIATHIGTSALFCMFMIYGKYAGNLDFSSFYNILPSNQITVCLILAIIGFGTKAGIIPFHVWLPEAHPVAPSHVSAVMSGVMIKTGVYAILRVISFNNMPSWLGYALLGIGITSGILGVLFAVAQRDLKRLLAYSSVENVGIIFIGLGVGVIGVNTGFTTIAVLGFAGSFLHILNHSIFKSLLFMGAGSVLHSTHTLDIDHLGGLLKRMPKTGNLFLVGSASIAGLPPFNGFISEFLIYLGMFTGVIYLNSNNSLVMIVGIISLAMIGGLSIACFTKAFGTIFLGEPRTNKAAEAKESSNFITLPMLFLAGSCLIIGLTGSHVIKCLRDVVGTFVPNHPIKLIEASHILSFVNIGVVSLLLFVCFFLVLRYLLLYKKPVRESVTWDCGYNFPSEKMQYTASSFAQPLTDLFSFILKTKKIMKPENSYFPKDSILETKNPDTVSKKLYQPIFLSLKKYFSYFKIIQQGKIQVYISYLVITLLALLIWNMR